ncbi:MAG: ABC transporter ATP-binding protein [Gemmataceae bacterium]|nr:ABC transporter ATP-binding protein [Gemmataceae bacterium]
MTPVVEFHEVSKWYGPVIGLNKLSIRVTRGITGLLGPNGAGKSTFLQLATGQLFPSQGEVRVLGQPVWNHPRLNRCIGLCPEQDAFYEWMSGWDFVYTSARLGGMSRSDARDATRKTLETVGMSPHAHRAIRGYSKGMRQRTKIAQALVHDPQVVFLDEPLSGTDPIARRDIMELVLKLAADGRSVVISSHVLHEVQALTSHIVLLNRGRLVAVGHVREIRDLIDRHPHHIVVVCSEHRRLAARLLEETGVEGVRILDGRSIMVETRQPDAFYSRLPQLVLEQGITVDEVYSEDDNLEAVFKYLVTK